MKHLPDIIQYTKVVNSKMFLGKYLNLEMNWGLSKNFSEAIKKSITVHCKDKIEMVHWLNKTADIILSAGCLEETCMKANVQLLFDRLSSWSHNVIDDANCSRGKDGYCIGKYYKN